MITFYRTGTAATGKFFSAMTFAREVTAYIKQKTGVEVRIAAPLGGNPQRIGWAAQFDDLAAMEAYITKLVSDPKYMEMTTKSADTFTDFKDEIWRSI